MLLPLADHEPFQLDGTVRYFTDAEAAYSFWETAVENYSRRALSFKTDRLPAISAAASVVAKATGDRYLAGLWRDDLLAGLGWYPNLGPGPSPKPYQEYIAPTWSWASLPIGAKYSHPRSDRTRQHDTNLEASVIDAGTVLAGQNPYGPVSDGAIVLSGFHCDAELTIPRRGFTAQLDFGHGDVQILGVESHQAYYALGSMRVEPDPNVDRLGGGNSRYLRRVMDPQQTVGIGEEWQPACSGTVHLLWLEKDISLILTPSRRKEGAYETGNFPPRAVGEFWNSGFFLQYAQNGAKIQYYTGLRDQADIGPGLFCHRLACDGFVELERWISRGCVSHTHIHTKLPRALVVNTSYDILEAPLADLS